MVIYGWLKVAIGIFCLGKTCGEIRTRCQKKMAVFRQNLEKEERQEERKEGGRGKKEGGKERGRERKKECKCVFHAEKELYFVPPPSPEERRERKKEGKQECRKKI